MNDTEPYNKPGAGCLLAIVVSAILWGIALWWAL